MARCRRRPWWGVRMNSSFHARWLVLCCARTSSRLLRWPASCNRLWPPAWRSSSGCIRSSSTENCRRLPRESCSASGFARMGKSGSPTELWRRLGGQNISRQSDGQHLQLRLCGQLEFGPCGNRTAFVLAQLMRADVSAANAELAVQDEEEQEFAIVPDRPRTLARAAKHADTRQAIGRRGDFCVLRFKAGDLPRRPRSIFSHMAREALIAEYPVRFEAVIGQRQIVVGIGLVQRRATDLDDLESRRRLENAMPDLGRLQHAVSG